MATKIEVGKVYMHKPMNQAMAVYLTKDEKIFTSWLDETTNKYLEGEFPESDFEALPIDWKPPKMES